MPINPFKLKMFTMQVEKVNMPNPSKSSREEMFTISV